MNETKNLFKTEQTGLLAILVLLLLLFACAWAQPGCTCSCHTYIDQGVSGPVAAPASSCSCCFDWYFYWYR